MTLSEKATNARIKKRGLHHPLTRDSIVLRVNAIQKAQCVDEVSINMEYNASLRDSWGPHTSQDHLKQSPQTQTHPQWHTHTGHLRRAKTCVPILNRPVSQNISNTIQSADTHRANKRASRSTTCPTEWPRPPECMLMSPNPECHVKTSTGLPRISPVRPIREQEEFRLLTATQLEDNIRAQRNLVQSCEHKLSKKDKKQQKMSCNVHY